MTSGRMPIRDGELFFDDRGAGHSLVLLHGGCLDHRMWDDHIGSLVRAGYRVIRYDARGHGKSAMTAPGDGAHEDLRQLLEGLAVPRASLVGTSFGARTAVDFCLSYPEMVEMTVLASPIVSGMRFTDSATVTLLAEQRAAGDALDSATFAERFLQAWVDGPHRDATGVNEMVRERCRRMVNDVFADHIAAIGPLADAATLDQLGHVVATEPVSADRAPAEPARAASIQIGMGATNGHVGYGAGAEPARGGSGRGFAIDRIHEVSAPVLVLVGDLDAPDIHAVAGRIEAEAQFCASAVIPGTGHMMAMEQPAAFNAAALTFLERARLVT